MIQVKSYTNYSADEQAKAARAIALSNNFLADPAAKAAWLLETCTENEGFSQEQIWDILCEDVTIELDLYSRFFSKVIGYFSGGDTIWDNRKYFDDFTDVEVASNDTHELSHLKGFTHYGVWATSVPYTLNRVLEAWGAKLAPVQSPATSQV